MWHNRGRGGAKYFRPGPSVWTPVDNVDNGVVSVKIGNRKYKKHLYLGKCGLTNYIFFYINPAIFFLEFCIIGGWVYVHNCPGWPTPCPQTLEQISDSALDPPSVPTLPLAPSFSFCQCLRNNATWNMIPTKEGDNGKTNKQILNYQEKSESRAAGTKVGFIYFLEWLECAS